MTKQMKAAMAAMLMVGTISMQAQITTTTKTTKVAPGETKTTVISKDAAAAGGTTKRSAGGKKRTGKKKTGKRAAAESATTRELRELRELRERQTAQQAQIDALTQANAAKDAALAQAQQAAQTAETQAQAATAQAQTVTTTVQANTDAVEALKSNVTDLQTTNAGLASTISANKVELTDKIESPTVLHYKGMTITPVAFFALEGVYRQRSINSDINTPFNTTPFMGANEARVSELNFSGRQSRLGGLFEGNAGAFKLSGYFESDFLSAASTSNSNQSNSYSLRVRQIWGKAETKSGFAMTAGQTWSLVTEDGKSTDVRTEKLPNTIDPQYMVGFSWARQPTVRLQQKLGHPVFGAGATIAMSVEQSQIQSFAAVNAPGNFFFGGAGTGGGLFAPTANYTNNIAPDVMTKFAIDTKHSHFEVGGLARFFRARIYPVIASASNGQAGTPGATAFNDTKIGGGGFASARVSVSKFLDLGASGMVGDGTGRYGSSQLADVTVHPNGTLEPVRNGHGLGSIEMHPAPKLDVYAYYGMEYAQRTQYATGVPGSPYTGYGVISAIDTGCNTEVPVNVTGNNGFTGSPSAANCSGNTRLIQEGMAGFTYRLVNSPKYGRLQYQATYSYLTRTGWNGIFTGTVLAPTSFHGPKATNNMVHIGVRYYIP